MIRIGCAILALTALAGCVMAPMPAPTPRPIEPAWATSAPLAPQAAARNFVTIVSQVEPVAERMCREARPDLNCDFQIVIDDRPNQPKNAFHTLDKTSGRPLIGFTLALIMDARSLDELAFVLGHEAGHHIAGHLSKTQESAATGALVLGGLAVLTGADPSLVQSMSQWGATVGARRYSKDYELEADVIGTLITLRAGYDPIRGAEFFSRLPDPGDTFLGSHPPNAQRAEVVRRTVEQARRGSL